MQPRILYFEYVWLASCTIACVAANVVFALSEKLLACISHTWLCCTEVLLTAIVTFAF